MVNKDLHFETGYSYISAANWDISTKFGLLTEFDLLKAVRSTDTKPKVVFSGHGRHLEKWIIHISAVGASNWTEFSSLMQNNMHITANWSRSKPDMADVSISKPEVAIYQPPIEIYQQNLVC